MDEKDGHEPQAVHHILYHVIFCPKRRRKVLVGPLQDRLKQIREQGVAEQGGTGTGKSA